MSTLLSSVSIILTFFQIKAAVAEPIRTDRLEQKRSGPRQAFSVLSSSTCGDRYTMLNTILQTNWFTSIASAYSWFMSNMANVLVIIGVSAAVICFLMGTIYYFTDFNKKSGKALLLDAIILSILMGIVYIGVLGATGIPDLSRIFHVPW
jgi:hypothetical protein